MFMVSVIIPAHNEREKINETVKASMQALSGNCEVIVVDDGSKDGTSFKAQDVGAKVIRIPNKLGKGNALMQGLHICTGNIVVFLDGDIGESALEICKLIEPIQCNKADMAVARFPESIYFPKRGLGIIRQVAYYSVKRLCNAELHAILSGQRAAKRDVFLKLMPFATGFGVEVGLTIDALRKGLRITEINCNMTHRVTKWNLKGIYHKYIQLFQISSVIVDRYMNNRA